MFIDEANHTHIAMPVNNLIEYSDNYSDTLGSLWQFKRDKDPDNTADLTVDNSESVIYKAALEEKTANADGGNSFIKNIKTVVPLEYLSRFWRSLEMPLINCKIHLKLNWIEEWILSIAGNSANFNITDAKLHIPIVTLSTKDNVNLVKQLSNGFKRSVYWNNYQTIPAKVIKKEANIYKLLTGSFQGLKRLLILA